MPSHEDICMCSAGIRVRRVGIAARCERWIRQIGRRGTRHSANLWPVFIGSRSRLLFAARTFSGDGLCPGQRRGNPELAAGSLEVTMFNDGGSIRASIGAGVAWPDSRIQAPARTSYAKPNIQEPKSSRAR